MISSSQPAFKRKRSPKIPATERQKLGARRIGILAIACMAYTSSLFGAPALLFLNVPFFPDKTDQCGPATLAEVLTFWGKSVQPQELSKEMYLAKLHGTLPMDLLLTAKKHGLKAEMTKGNL